MKKVFLSMLAVAALAACSNDDNNVTDNDLVPIRLGAGVENVVTKAPTDGPINISDQFEAGVGGWETDATPEYKATTWYSTANVTASKDPVGINLTPGQNYNSSEDVETYIKAWHPAGEPTAEGTVTFTNTKGNMDVMIADAVHGNKSTIITDALNFEHLTTQLIFEVKEGVEGVEEGTTLTSIEVQNAQLPTGINLTNNTVTYAAANNLMVDYTAASLEIGDVQKVGKPMMIAPMDKLEIIVTTNKTTYPKTQVEIAAADKAKILAGNAYTITLTLGRTGIELKASVTDWIPASGSAVLQ